MKQSVIKHGTNTRFVMLRESYREMCIYIKNGKIKHNDTAASMLSLFEHLTDAKIAVAESEGKKQPDLWLYLSKPFLETALLGTAAKMTISEAEKLLVTLGLISVKQEMEGDAFTRKAYLLNCELIQWVLDNKGWSKIREGGLILEGGYSNFRGGGSLILEGGYSNFRGGGSLILDYTTYKYTDKENIVSSSSSSEKNFENFEEEKAVPQPIKDELPKKDFVAVALEYANMSDFVKYCTMQNPELTGIDADYQYYFDSAKRKSTAKTATALYSSGLGFIKSDAAKNNIKLITQIQPNAKPTTTTQNNRQPNNPFAPSNYRNKPRQKTERMLAFEANWRKEQAQREAMENVAHHSKG